MKKILIVIAVFAVFAPVVKQQWTLFWEEVGRIADKRRFRDGHL